MTFFTEAYNTVKNYKCSGNAFLPHTVIIPLENEKDSNYVPVVKIGDKVEEGQIIATYDSPENQSTSKIYSSIPGTVVDIIPSYLPNGKQKFGIKIALGGKFNYVGKKITESKAELILASSISSKLIDFGVLNTFDTAKPVNIGQQIKNSPKAKNLVVRLFDEDNFRYTDGLISKFLFPQIYEAAKTLARAFNAEGILFAVNAKDEKKNDYIRCVNELEDTASNSKTDTTADSAISDSSIKKSDENTNEASDNSTDISKNDSKNDSKKSFKDTDLKNKNVRFVYMNVKRYPSGTKREITSAFNRNLKKSCDFKITKDDIFIDSSTAYEVYKAINLNIPPISKLIFVHGNCLKASCLLDVKIGTTLKELINQIGGFAKEPSKIIVNGMIHGSFITNIDVPVTSSIKSVTFLSKSKITDSHIYACINCGNCRFTCPVKISPDILYNNMAHFKEMPEYLEQTALACTNCGLCNIGCPARLPLSQSIKQLQEQILQKQEILQN